MLDPVSGCIPREGKVTYRITVDFVIELEEDTEASVSKDDMRGFREYVVIGKSIFGSRESLRGQVFLDREVRELYDLVASPIDDSDETRADGQHRFLCVFRAPICVKCSRFGLVELNSKDLREFFDSKCAN